MGLRVQPKGPVVTLGHADLPLLLPRAGGAGLHGGRERARLAVLPGEHGQASFGPSVAVVLVQMAGAQARAVRAAWCARASASAARRAASRLAAAFRDRASARSRSLWARAWS